jgi:hypothetical protein
MHLELKRDDHPQGQQKQAAHPQGQPPSPSSRVATTLFRWRRHHHEKRDLSKLQASIESAIAAMNIATTPIGDPGKELQLVQHARKKAIRAIEDLLEDRVFWRSLERSTSTQEGYAQGDVDLVSDLLSDNLVSVLARSGYHSPPPPSAGELVLEVLEAVDVARSSFDPRSARRARLALMGLHQELEGLDGKHPKHDQKTLRKGSRMLSYVLTGLVSLGGLTARAVVPKLIDKAITQLILKEDERPTDDAPRAIEH